VASLPSKPLVMLLSGGSASNMLAQRLEDTKMDVVNVISVFDNGGSTGALRHLAPIPAIGDIRNRLLALSGNGPPDQRAAKALFEFRFSERKAENQLREELRMLATGDHHLTSDISPNDRSGILQSIQTATRIIPPSFSLREMSIGNLLIFGRTLQSNDLISAIDWARGLLAVRSRILPVTLQSVHLGAMCENGHWVLGQAAITNEKVTFPSPVKSMHFIDRENSYAFQSKVDACPDVLQTIRSADVLIFGFGSFLSSILPHFMVRGIGREIRSRLIPKLFLCNPTIDKESAHLSIAAMVSAINAAATSDGYLGTSRFPAVTHILHFGPDEHSRVQAGDLSGYDVIYRDLTKVSGFSAMAQEVSQFAAQTVDFSSPIAPIQKPVEPLIMFDLDDTLFDYFQLRINATASVIEGLVTDPHAVSLELAQILRPPFTDILTSLGLPDLRKQWDSSEIIAFAYLLSDPSNRELIMQVGTALDKDFSSEGDYSFSDRLRTYRFSSRWQKSPPALKLIREIAHVRNCYGSDLSERSRRFRNFISENAALSPGAMELIAEVRASGFQVHLVSEGDTTVQTFKFVSLGLSDLMDSCVVTDATLSVASVLDELFMRFRDADETPQCIGVLFDQLVPFTVKSRAFFSKLIHALVDPGLTTLRDHLMSPRYLTVEEWGSTQPHCAVMVGDRYRKDLEPLLQLGPSGVYAYRVLSKRYRHEDPNHEILDALRPFPTGLFPDLRALEPTFLGAIKTSREKIARPDPMLPDPHLIDEVCKEWKGISEDSARVLLGIQSESVRQAR
jgi:uncharacterized cofD-like protein